MAYEIKDLIEFTHNLKVDREITVQLLIQSIDHGDFAEARHLVGHIEGLSYAIKQLYKFIDGMEDS